MRHIDKRSLLIHSCRTNVLTSIWHVCLVGLRVLAISRASWKLCARCEKNLLSLSKLSLHSQVLSCQTPTTKLLTVTSPPDRCIYPHTIGRTQLHSISPLLSHFPVNFFPREDFLRKKAAHSYNQVIKLPSGHVTILPGRRYDHGTTRGGQPHAVNKMANTWGNSEKIRSDNFLNFKIFDYIYFSFFL